MGAVLETPTACPLCNELTREPVVLKCNHRFCRRCIGDLWSVTPDGPYHCPEWRCKTVYRSLPFDCSLARTSVPSKRAAATSSNGETQESGLRSPSLTSRLLGKRKASSSAPDQPVTKRSVVETSRETPAASVSDKSGPSTAVETPAVDVQSESPQPASGIGPTCTDKPGSEAAPASVAPQEISNHREAGVRDVSDSSDEVDICDAPSLSTPARDVPVIEIQDSPENPSAPITGGSSPQMFQTPVKPLPGFIKDPVASGSPSCSGISSAPEKRGPRPVPCHYCPKTGYQSAVKTCLVCGASMCLEHLRPHLDSPVFQNHTLVPPVEDISAWRCQEHQEVNRIYCRQCSVCVCTVCTVIGSHRDHPCVSIREADRELRANLKEDIRQLQEAEQQVKSQLTELTQKKESFRVTLTKAREGVQRQYEAIREALEQEEQSALQCVTKEESRVLGGLEDKLGRLRSSLLSIQQGLGTLETLADSKIDKRIQDQAFIMEYSKVSQIPTNLGSCQGENGAPEELDQARLKCLQSWTEKRLESVTLPMPGKDRDLYRLLYGIVPFLDPDTAHAKLLLSDNNRKVTYVEAPHFYWEHESRFTSFPQVLGSRGLRGGRCYWEVSVSADEGRWKVGLCEGQIERKGQRDSSRLGFNGFSWCLACDKRKVEALHNKAAVPLEADGLRRVGVFLDFDEGILSFFNVTPGGSLALMHSFQHRFSEALYPAFSVSKTQLTVCELFET